MPNNRRDFSESQSGSDDRNNNLGLKGTLSVLVRRRRSILAIVATVTLIGYLLVSHLPPTYSAEAVLVVEPRKANVLATQSAQLNQTLDLSSIRTEAEILKSLVLAEKVTKELKLQQHPEFGPQPGIFVLLLERILASRHAEATGEVKKIPNIKTAQLQPAAEVATQLQGRLRVSNDGRSAILRVRFDAKDPELAASVVNTFARLYIIDQVTAKTEASRKASIWLNERVMELRDVVRDSDGAVQKFRDENRLTETRGMNVTVQQLAELNTQLTLAASDRAQKEAALSQLNLMIQSGEGPQAVLQVMTSPLILRLKEQEAQILRREAELLTRFGDAHPSLANVRAEKGDLQDSIRLESGYIARGLTNEVDAARRREASLRRSLVELEERAHQLNQAEVQLRELEREANANRALYESYLTRAKEMTAQSNFQQADARIITLAHQPKAPNSPKRLQILGLIIIGAFAGAFAVAIVVDRLDTVFHTAEELEKASDVVVLTSVPDTKHGTTGLRLLLDQPTSAYSESIRYARTSLELASNPHPKIVLITSSVPHEGKTTFSVSLARSAAQAGKRVLLVDCDLRHPSIGKLLGASTTSGLTSYLAGGSSIDDHILHDRESGLDYLAARPGATNPQSLLESVRMRELIDTAREMYDFVVLDGTPVLPVSDALVLARLADATIMLIRWNKTQYSAVREAIKRLRSTRTSIFGTLTRVGSLGHRTYPY